MTRTQVAAVAGSFVGGAIFAAGLVGSFHWPAEIESVAMVVQAAVIIATGVFAWHQLGESRVLRDAQTRPYVIVDFDAQRRRPFIFLVVRNIGATAARDVQIDFQPRLASATDTAGYEVASVGLFNDGAPMLAPGVVIDMFFDSAIEREERRKGDDPLPDRYEATLTYTGHLGRRYTDRLSLDLGMYRNLTYIDEKTIDDVAKQLEKVGETLKAFRSTEKGIRVVTPEYEQQKAAEWRQKLEVRRREQAEAESQRVSQRTDVPGVDSPPT